MSSQADSISSLAQAPQIRVKVFWRRNARLLRRGVLLFLIAACIRTLVGEPSVVPTGSMEGTILIGDHLFLDKALYGPTLPGTGLRLPALRKIRRGDIVAFRFPRDPNLNFLKRVTALGGDRVEILAGVVHVNGKAVQEPYAIHHGATPSGSMAARIVPQGELFMLGDNRDDSEDSRDWGTVPVQNVIGEPIFIFWSYDAPSRFWLHERLKSPVRFYGSLVANFFARTRWRRTGTWL